MEWNEILTGEMLLFGVLSKTFYIYPEKAWLESLVQGEVFAEAPFASGQADTVQALAQLMNWSDQQRAGISDQAFEELRVDYTRLFMGPGKVLTPPWESVYFSEERLTFQQETLQVRDWYRRFGLRAEKIYQEPDDHIGLELEFIAHLAKIGLAALEQNDPAALDNALAAQRNFSNEHLFKWASLWCSQVQAQAQTDFYRGMATLCRGALAELASVLGVALPKAVLT